MTAPSWLEIDLSRLDANLQTFRDLLYRNDAIQPELCAVVKADAYGLGITQIARRLADLGVGMLAVYSADQARQIVDAGIVVPILVLMPIDELHRSDALYRPAVSGRLHLTVHAPAHLAAVNRLGQSLGCRLPVHLYMDTGMSRSGMTHDQTAAALELLPTLRGTRLAGVYTHLATADNDPAFVDEQLDRFDLLVQGAQDRIDPTVCMHVANTYATLRSPRFHRSMVRVGLGLLGYGDTLIEQTDEGTPIRSQLNPLVRWVSRIIHTQQFSAGASVGYGRTHRLKRDSILGVVPVGYGDGYPATAGNRSCVVVRRTTEHATVVAPVVGRVSMDQIVIDLTDCDPPTATKGSAWENHTVELISDDPVAPNALPQLAEQAGSSCYELLCRLSPRIPRVYKYAQSQRTIHQAQRPALAVAH